MTNRIDDFKQSHKGLPVKSKHEEHNVIFAYKFY